jgi:hypothetical protein
MSIASEITRLHGVKGDILTAIADKGVTVPADSMLDDCPDLIASISGGGSPIPEGYELCQYVKCIAQGSIYNHSGETPLITNVAKDDIISFYYEVGNDATSWLPETVITTYYFPATNSGRDIKIRTNTNENKSVVDGFSSSKTLSGIIKDFSIIRKGPDKMFLNGVQFNDNYNYIPSRCEKIFSVTNASIVGGKLYFLKIFGANNTLKYHFLPMKKNGTTDVFYDVVTGIEFVLDTNKFICGPVVS